jgi:hypothetical protein
MKMNDIISMLAPKKSNDLLNSFIESIILGGPKTYDVDESVLRGDDKQTGMMVPPNWVPRPKPNVVDFEEIGRNIYGSDACAKCRAAQDASMRNGVMNIADPCRGVC